jgi:hypothetical protein
MEHPYRASALAVGKTKRKRLADPDPSPTWWMKAIEYSDGTTWIGVRHAYFFAGWLLYPPCLLALLYVGMEIQSASAALKPTSLEIGILSGFVLGLTALFLRFVVCVEELGVGRSSIIRRRRFFRRSEVFLLEDISSVVISGSGDDTHVCLQLNRKLVEIGVERPASESELRWLAKRLRRGLETARAAGHSSA